MAEQWRLLVLAAQHKQWRGVHVSGAARDANPVVRSAAVEFELHLPAIGGRSQVVDAPIADSVAGEIGLGVSHLKGGKICGSRFDVAEAWNRKMDRRCRRRPGHPHKSQYLEIEFLDGGVDTNRGMSIVGDRDAKIYRRVFEPRTRHREDDLLAMHRERRALSEYRRAQKIKFHVPLCQRQLALGRQASWRAGISVDDDLAADRPGHTEVSWIDQQRQPQGRRKIVKTQRQVVHSDALLLEIHGPVEG